MKNQLSITSPGVTISATDEGDYIFIIRLAAHVCGQGDGGRAIEHIKSLGRVIKLFSVADFSERQNNLDRFYITHGFKVEGNFMVWRPEQSL